MISIIILTKNEEIDIQDCLQSVSWCDDVHVLDSGSVDQTVAIAVNNGAKVMTNMFVSFGKQRNFALDTMEIKYDWVLFLDADERATQSFKTAVINAIDKAGIEVAGFYCCWKMMLEDRWLKYSDNFPKWQFRLMYKGKARFTDFGHGQKEHEVFGKILHINEPYLHYGFSKGWYHWIERHNKYSTQEAAERLQNCPPIKNIFSKQVGTRNSALKSWLSQMPGWPVIRFFYAYFINLGFLEGIPGLIYCTNMGYYEFLIQIKMREIKKRSLVHENKLEFNA